MRDLLQDSILNIT